MKDKALIWFSLLLGTAALCYSAWLHQHSAVMATEALRSRERAFVAQYAPKVSEMCSGMGRTNVFASPPQTLEELIRPLTEIVNRMEEPDINSTPK